MNQNAVTSPVEALHEDLPALLAGIISLENLPSPQEMTLEQAAQMSEAEQAAWLKHHGLTPETWAQMLEESLPTK